MPDYRESTAPATTWQRASSITIHNPLLNPENRRVEFHEDSVVKVNDQVVAQTPVGGPMGLRRAFNPTDSFDLVDPATGAPMGRAATHAELYVMLHSLYLWEAKARDEREAAAAAQAAEQAPAPETP